MQLLEETVPSIRVPSAHKFKKAEETKEPLAATGETYYKTGVWEKPEDAEEDFT